MPLLKASRCPRRVSWRGRNESSATKLARNGKPVNGVFAPVIRISAVATWTMTNPMWPIAPLPNAASATCEITVG